MMDFKSKNPKIYIFAGKARTGKDTCANYIKEFCEKNNKKYLCLQYSGYLKDYAKKITNWDGTDETKPRQLLIELGTGLIRGKMDRVMLVRRMIEDLTIMSYFFDIIVVSDARLPEELDMPREELDNVKIINVIRPNFENDLTTEQKKSLTEVGLDDYNNYDYTIINDGNLDDLKIKVKRMLEEND